MAAFAFVDADLIRERAQLIFENRVAIFNDEETAAIFHKGLESPDDLGEVEKLRFLLVFAHAVDAIFNTYSQTEASGFSRDTWEAQIVTAKRLMRTAGGRKFWGVYRNEYRRDFQAEIDTIIQGRDQTVFDPLLSRPLPSKAL